MTRFFWKEKKRGKERGQIIKLDPGKDTAQDKMKNLRRQGNVDKIRLVVQGGVK